MKKMTTVVTMIFACMAFATGALAADPLKSADNALSNSAATVSKASQKESDLKAKVAKKKETVNAKKNKAKAIKSGANQKADTATKNAKGVKDATANDLKDLQK